MKTPDLSFSWIVFHSFGAAIGNAFSLFPCDFNNRALGIASLVSLAAVFSGEECCVMTLKTAAKETIASCEEDLNVR